MTEETKQKLKYWLFGLFTGGVIAAPVTTLICKNVYEKKMNDAVAKAQDEGETRGMNAMAEYAISQQEEKVYKEEDYGVPSEEEINNYDLSIDDEDASEEARERTEAHARYLDMIDRYNGNAEIPPHIISGEDFINQQYTEKSYVNWYEKDNVFEEDLVIIQDPYATFGVTDGHELFKNDYLRPDPDICYVRNERTTTDFEISRIHGSYAEIVGGEPGLGEADS